MTIEIKSPNPEDITLDTCEADIAYDSAKSSEENLQMLADAVTIEGKSLNAAQKEVFKEEMRACDPRGYFGESPKMSMRSPDVTRVILHAGGFRIYNEAGQDIGSFSLYHRKNTTNEKVRLKTAVQTHAELGSLEDAVESVTLGAHQFQDNGDGTYEIGDKHKFMRNEPSGADFHAAHPTANDITFVETQAGTGRSVTKHAAWSNERNCYVKDNGNKMWLKHGYHFAITPNGMREADRAADGSTDATSVMEAPAELVVSAHPSIDSLELRDEAEPQAMSNAEFAERSNRFMSYFKNFMETVFAQNASVTINANRINNHAKNSYESYFKKGTTTVMGYSPDEQDDLGERNNSQLKLAGGIMVEEVNPRRTVVILPRAGVYTIDMNGPSLKIAKSGHDFVSYNASTNSVTGDSNRMVEFLNAFQPTMNREVTRFVPEDTRWNDDRMIRVVDNQPRRREYSNDDGSYEEPSIRVVD